MDVANDLWQSAAQKHFERTFALWSDLSRSLPTESLGMRLPARSNTIGEQLWCLIGARESYTQALQASGWKGFSCSLGKAELADQAAILAAAEQSAAELMQTIAALDWTPERAALLLDLLEHEAQHQGQLIRYLYALDLPIPASWKQRWALE